MWDNADMLNGCADALYALCAAALIYAGVYALVYSPLLPLRHLELRGDLAHMNRVEAEAAARAVAGGTFLSVDPDAVRGAFESLPWVRKVEVRRMWPDRLEVSIEEHVALARWGADARTRHLVDTHGEVFEGELPDSVSLPRFVAPSGSSEDVTRRYAEFRQLLAPLAFEPREILLSPRHAWRVQLSNGLMLELGRDQLREPMLRRLARFVSAYPQTLARLDRKLEYVDLRYPRGFALRVPEIGQQTAPGARRHQGGDKGKA